MSKNHTKKNITPKTSANDDLDRAMAQVAASRQKEIDEKRKQQFLKATKYIVDDINGHVNIDKKKKYTGWDFGYELRREYFLINGSKLNQVNDFLKNNTKNWDLQIEDLYRIADSVGTFSNFFSVE